MIHLCRCEDTQNTGLQTTQIMKLSSAAMSISLFRIPTVHLSLLQWMLVLFPLFHPPHSDLTPLHSAPRCCLVLNLPPIPSHPSATAQSKPICWKSARTWIFSPNLTSRLAINSALAADAFSQCQYPSPYRRGCLPQNGRSVIHPQRSIVRQPSPGGTCQ